MIGGIRVTSGQIQKQKTLVTGRFAVVHIGLVALGNENKHVAIKTLKRTHLNRYIENIYLTYDGKKTETWLNFT